MLLTGRGPTSLGWAANLQTCPGLSGISKTSSVLQVVLSGAALLVLPFIMISSWTPPGAILLRISTCTLVKLSQWDLPAQWFVNPSRTRPHQRGWEYSRIISNPSNVKDEFENLLLPAKVASKVRSSTTMAAAIFFAICWSRSRLNSEILHHQNLRLSWRCVWRWDNTKTKETM